jgi:hypothetical protein
MREHRRNTVVREFVSVPIASRWGAVVAIRPEIVLQLPSFICRNLNRCPIYRVGVEKLFPRSAPQKHRVRMPYKRFYRVRYTFLVTRFSSKRSFSTATRRYHHLSQKRNLVVSSIHMKVIANTGGDMALEKLRTNN